MRFTLFLYNLCLILTRGICRELVDDYFHRALQQYRNNDLESSKNSLRQALLLNPHHGDANGMLGAIYLIETNIKDGTKHLEISFENGGFQSVEIVANYLYGLFRSGDIDKGIEIFRKLKFLHSTKYQFYFNSILLLISSGRDEEVRQYSLEFLKDSKSLWAETIAALNDHQLYNAAEYLGEKALELFGNDVGIMFQVALSLHFQNKFPRALQLYEILLELDQENLNVVTNIGAIYQALGHYDHALLYYRISAEKTQNDPGFLNNFGILLLQSGIEAQISEGVQMLEKALSLDPFLENTLVNLASYYQDNCMIRDAEALYKRALNLNSLSAKLIEIRIATLMSPVVSSWNQMVDERRQMIVRLKEILSLGPPPDALFRELDSTLDRIHFYIVYSGLNDRPLQELVTATYRNSIRNISRFSSHLNRPFLSPPISRLKVGFLSKYFGVYEPHGMLLDGVIKYLPRLSFEVYVITMAPTEGKFLSPIIEKYADHVVFIPIVLDIAFQKISALNLDILIFAETLSEPTVHFLSQSRLAPVQVAFWGNPVTSGSNTIDYFVSNDFMEHPFRTRLKEEEEPYTEQVVLLPGQGIWYSAPDSSDSLLILKALNFTIAPQNDFFLREEFGFRDDWFIYLCPQSVFKLHPLFDHVLASILEKSPKSHLVLTTGRRKMWTSLLKDRVARALHPYLERCHFIERVTSQKFLALIKLSDTLLHPFPFDGSRTSADSLSVGIPYVTLPAEYLRGRMGAAFLRTMNIPELVAHNLTEYIEIAVRLSSDSNFYMFVKSLIQARSWLIWDDLDSPFQWTRFLRLSAALSPPSWEEFIDSSGSDIKAQNKFRSLREQNQLSFDLRWGRESWLLNKTGIPYLPHIIEGIPAIFNNWKWTSAENLSLDVTHVLEEAKKHIQIGDFSRAYDFILHSFDEIPSDPRLFLELGILQFFQGNYQAAVAHCEKAAALLNQTNSESLQVYGCIGISATYLLDEAIETSLVTALLTFGRYSDCLDIITTTMSIPPISRGGSYFILLSLFNLSKSQFSHVRNLERKLKNIGSMEFDTDLVLMVQKIQEKYPHLITPARSCLSGILGSEDQTVLTAYLEVSKIFQPFAQEQDIQSNISSRKNIALITQLYDSKSFLDLENALLKNLVNPQISEIFLLNEHEFDLSHFLFPEKLHQVVIGKRLTFQDAFYFANRYLSGRVVIIGNSDIYFDHTLNKLEFHTLESGGIVFALSKWTNWDPTNNFIFLSPRIDSQDAWIFRSPINEEVVDLSSFFLGVPRCDNRLAAILNHAGHQVLNPSLGIHAIELMSMNRDEKLYEMKDAPLGDTMNVFLSTLREN